MWETCYGEQHEITSEIFILMGSLSMKPPHIYIYLLIFSKVTSRQVFAEATARCGRDTVSFEAGGMLPAGSGIESTNRNLGLNQLHGDFCLNLIKPYSATNMQVIT